MIERISHINILVYVFLSFVPFNRNERVDNSDNRLNYVRIYRCNVGGHKIGA